MAKPHVQKPDQKKASSEALIKRYMRVVLERPSASFPLQRLAELYRARDGKLDALVADLESQVGAKGPSAFSAQLVLGGLYRFDGQFDRAKTTFEAAIGGRPESGEARLALASFLEFRGDKAGAKTAYEAALPRLKKDNEKEPVHRRLLTLSLDLKDWEAAKGHHRYLVKRAHGSFFARAELGRELMLREEYARAEEEYRSLLKFSVGDHRAVAPTLRDLGRALAKQGKESEALKVLRRGLRIAGKQSGLRREILGYTVEVYRSQEKLAELIVLLRSEANKDFDNQRLLGELLEETGQLTASLKAYKKALKIKAKDIEVRLKVVQLLQIQGELGRVTQHYQKLIIAAPHNPDFVFRLAEAWLQRGRRDKALEQLRKLEARSGTDEDILGSLVDFYERVGEGDRAMALLERLSRNPQGSARYLIELGDRYFAQGEEERAQQIWKRILNVVPGRADALHAYGEVLLQHDLVDEALHALRQAMKLAPGVVKYTKSFALALERTGSRSSRALRREQYKTAEAIWQSLLDKADPRLAREARQHIVTLWSLSAELKQRLRPLERRLAFEEPDLESGRLLGEAYIRLRRYGDAERVLRVVISHEPTDIAALKRLERVLVLQRKMPAAIEVLEQLRRADRRRAQVYYERMAKYSAELYRDDQAIEYAARAVELSPDDARGHRRLGEMYRRRQDFERAILQFRKAIAKNDRLFEVYLELALLLANASKTDEADRLLRHVVRASPDEELISQAAKLSIQLNLGRPQLAALEKDLLPLALGNPERPIYRRLLLELYGTLAFPLAHRAQSSDPAEAALAQAALGRLGQRAVKPLLDALADPREGQQRIAIDLLSFVRNKSSAPALFSFAVGDADSDLRVRAMSALGMLEEPSLLPRFREYLLPAGGAVAAEDPVSFAAAWAVSRLPGPGAKGLLRELLFSNADEVRGLSLLALVSSKRFIDTAVVRELLDARTSRLVRACAALALGEMGQPRDAEALVALGSQFEGTPLGATRLLALARLGGPSANREIAEALLSAVPGAPNAAASAAIALVKSGRLVPARLPSSRSLAHLLSQLMPDYDGEPEVAAAIRRLARALGVAVVTAVQSSPENARVTANALMASERVGFGALRLRQGAPTEELTEIRELLETIAQKAAEPFARLSRHPSDKVRALALSFLGRRPEASAQAVLLAALQDPSADVIRVAIALVTEHAIEAARPGVIDVLRSAVEWPLRVSAAQALGALPSHPEAIAALQQVASLDSLALVREAAVLSLFALDPKKARKSLKSRVENDPEPRVRELSKTLLEKR
ncbi:MAG: HEAT repeat domain-containing protein [Polyangiaceae bacterium]|nr:HEAT repeat domain-containing protein [Polyangiaceae bacterium]